MLYYIR